MIGHCHIRFDNNNNINNNKEENALFVPQNVTNQPSHGRLKMFI
ncbi:hypothetical protein PP707_04345 [Acetobacter pasteurianus]|nr:hypothetical protein [Acetobacter pasteurianus]